MNRRILFVGETPGWLRELERTGQRLQFECKQLGTGLEALAFLDQHPTDAVVADAMMRGMDGIQFLGEVMHRHPAALRFIRANLTSQQQTMKCLGTAHQFWAKPGDAVGALRALEEAFTFDNWLPGPNAPKLLRSLTKLPSSPEIYFRVVKELQKPDASLERIGELVAEDAAISAKLLQLANSAIFGLQLEISSPAEAVMYLGVDTTKSLILLAHTYSYFDGLTASDFSAEKLRRHSLATGRFAREIARTESDDPELAGTSFTAGLLHDVGKLLLAANLPKEFRESISVSRMVQIDPWEAETRVFGVNHAEVGGCLLSIWGLPVKIVEAVALHHHPAQLISRGFSPLTAVHVANVLDHEAGADEKDARTGCIDESYLNLLQAEARLKIWREACVASVEV